MTKQLKKRKVKSKNAELLQQAEKEILEQQRVSDYEVREYPIEVIVSKFAPDNEEDFELFIPDYQRDYVWNHKQQARFIESLLINLPVPYIFVADSNDEEYEGLLEIIDGSQRIRTIAQFVKNEFKLGKLDKLPSLEGFYFRDLPKPRQRRFLRRTLRTIELTELADEETRRDMFDRLNSGGTPLKYMEVIRGTKKGKFMDLIHELAANKLFKKLCPITKAKLKNREPEELVLRYFAYLNGYENFGHRVDDFLSNYLDSTTQELNKNPQHGDSMREEFLEMLAYVKQHFPHGFKKTQNANSVPRLRFECIAVGTTLALREDPDHEPVNIEDWLHSEEFKKHTRSDGSNSKPRVESRLLYAKNQLLGLENE